MPKKTPKVHAMRLKAQVDIQVDPGSGKSLEDARGIKASIEAHVKKLGYTLVIIDYRLSRIPVNPVPEPKAEPEPEPEPEPETTEPAADGLDIPARLDRRAETEPAAAE